MFIAFEGPDLSGKSTQVDLLVRRLRGCGHSVLHLAFPSKAPFGRMARECIWNPTLTLEAETPRARALLTQACMLADRCTAAVEIQVAVSRGTLVVADRWTMSGEIYGEAEGLDRDLLLRSQYLLPAPEMWFLLSAPVDVLVSRMLARGGQDRYEERPFLERVSTLYARCPQAVFAIDGDRPQERIADEIWGHVATFLRRQSG
jgi:dTMP kinase